MRGDDQQQSDLYSYVSPEQRVPKDRPLRPLRKRVDLILKRLSPRFAAMYAERGRPSIARRNCCEPCCCNASTRCAASAC